jgi:hypothetical protein
MPMTIDECTKVLDEYICPRLDQIGAVFLDPDVKVTLIVRTPAAPNGELVITADDLAEVRKVIDRREAAGITRERGASRSDRLIADTLAVLPSFPAGD